MKKKWSFIILLAVSLFALTIMVANPALARKTGALISSVFEKKPTNTIKERILKMKEALEKDDEQLPEIIKETEKAAQNSKDSVEAAILHSMTAQMYDYYYDSHSWDINGRTDLNNYIPEDIREWTKNIFKDTIEKELEASLKPAALLQQTPAAKWKEIMVTGQDDEALRPSLYEFLAYRALNMQPSEKIYSELIGYLRSVNHSKALLLCQLEHLNFQHSDQDNKASMDAYMASLDSLMTLNQNKDFSTEIRIAQVDLMDQMKDLEGADRDALTARQLSICEEGCRLYPHYGRIGRLTNFRNDTEQPSINIKLTNTTYPGKNVKVRVNYRNTKQIKIQIYNSHKDLVKMASRGYDNRSNALSRGKLVEEKSFSLNNKNTFSFSDSLIEMNSLEPGLYECFVSVPGTKMMTSSIFSVSRLASADRNMLNGKKEIFVTDFLSGKPVSKAEIAYYGTSSNDLKLIGKTKTDENGLALIPADRKISAYHVSLPNDTASMLSRTYFYYQRGELHLNQEARLSLFTDRGLYRPGQTVFFKGLAFVSETDTSYTLTGKEYTISFRDPNGKEISNLKVKTNAFGSFNGEFKLPKEVLSGRFSLSTQGANCGIRVEEYKRPSFYAEIDPVKEDVAFGDNVTIKGSAKTFSGITLKSGNVKWHITCRPLWFYYRFMNTSFSERQVAEGESAIAADGSFSFSFRPSIEESQNSFFHRHYQSYEITATITDSKGESQEATSLFSVGDASLVITSSITDQMDKENVQVSIETHNLNNQPVQTKGSFTIVKLSDRPLNDQRPEEETKYQEGATVAKGSFVSGEKLSSKIFSSLPSGRYRIKMNALDSKGRDVNGQQDFVLYSKNDKCPPVFKETWVLKNKTVCQYGEDADFTFGTSYDNTYILYELFQDSKLIHRELIKLNNENRRFLIPFKKEYGDGIVASFTFMKEGKFYNETVDIKHALPNMNLSITPITFRDHLLPGSKETWTFRILDSDSAAVNAEVLAGLYDASLDQIDPFNWSFYPDKGIVLSAPRFNKGNYANETQDNSSVEISWTDVPEYKFGDLNWEDALSSLGRSHRYVPMLRSAKNMMLTKSDAAIEETDMVMAAAPMMAKELSTGNDIQAPTANENIPQASQGKPQLRENFNETAFFFPTLLTDKQGGLSMQFTMPESNTTWKLQALAHTKELKHGMLTEQIITSKPLMVVPSLPRFLRLGDKVSIHSQVINQSKDNLNGKARLELFDPTTDTLLKGYPMSQSFTLDADSTIALSWDIDVPDCNGLVGCRIIAETNEGSDGEQHLLPILSNQLLITESTPFFFAEPGEKQISWNNSEGRTPFRLTLEMTANPIWYAVQALPTLAEPSYDDVVSWLNVFFSNTLSAHIAQSNPQIKKIIDVWTAQGGTASTLYSNLQKNDELKQILLQETPWVMEAQNETEQKQRLSLLFDLNRGANLRSSSFQHLKDHQEEDGGFSWFKGFPSSDYITLYAVDLFTHLVHLNAMKLNDEETQMVNNAFAFLDKSILKDYENLKKEKSLNKNYIVSDFELEYLYLRSFYPELKYSNELREPVRFFTEQAQKWEKQDLYNKGMTAILMHHIGKENIASNILDWLMKTATQSDEMGMYWANNRFDNNFFASLIDVHCMLMDAFQEIRPDTKRTNSMKQWLLNQKRTQDWNSSIENVDAIYSLLLTGSNWLGENNQCVATYGNKSYSTSDGEIATGYLKTTIPTNTAQSHLSLKKEGTSPTWGAVYNQYFTSIDKVEKSNGVLNVEKKFFVETNNGKEIQLTPVSNERSLKVGDKLVVRLIVRTDRDMNYVFLKDLHAGCMEAVDQLSGMQYRDGVFYYHSAKDVSEQYFFETLPKGTFVLEYPAYVVRDGEYAGGLSTIQCLYAPEFVSHTESNKLTVLK